jgi:hypothetical protein
MKYEMLNWSHVMRSGMVDTWQEVTAADLMVQGSIPVKNQQFIGKVNQFHRNTTTKAADDADYDDCNPFTGGMEHFLGHKKPWRKPIRAEAIPDVY